ncbi:bifunctional diguanylate cyclase/phosphodiesterase [Geodermatophilaceae bacterium NBWT11]|nr:bifunctional diguanylate cyclase/phosphodiesterase [Geodermatophilaceae bacterium NBWT11]
MKLLRTPEVATPRAMAGTIAVFYVVGGLAGLLITWGADTRGAQEVALLTLSATAFACAVVVHRWARGWPRWAFHVAISSAVVLIAVAVVLAPDAASALVVAALMSFVVVVGYLFFSLVVGTAYLVGALVAATLALHVQGDVALPTALALQAVVVALGTVTRSLVLRASGASRDPLTDLKNRRGFDQAMQELLATGDDAPLSGALLDLDGFKAVNDTQGHAAGDLVLRQVAEAWTSELPAGAVLARHGGDEFALLLPGLAGTEALALVRGVCARHPELRLSVGVAQHVPGESAAQLMRRADQALYAAKAAGRGRCELEGGDVPQLVSDLAAAVRAGDVHVYFQPIQQLATDSVLGVEALARWNRPGVGPVPPEEFIALAERHHLIGALGEHVLRSATGQLADLYARTGRRLRLGVNVSGLELCDPGYPERVRAILAETGWPAAETVLEVTESLLDAESTEAVCALDTLRAQGIVVAIDDFGTGYSSLSRLDTLPADVLKVDSSFIATITTSPRRAQLLRSIVGLATGLGLDVVAEGVESAEQAALLDTLGCTYGQGWLYGPPAPLAEVVAGLGWSDDAQVSAPQP